MFPGSPIPIYAFEQKYRASRPVDTHSPLTFALSSVQDSRVSRGALCYPEPAIPTSDESTQTDEAFLSTRCGTSEVEGPNALTEFR